MRNPNAGRSRAGRARTPARRRGALVLAVLLALPFAPSTAAADLIDVPPAVPLDLPPASASVEVLAVNGAGCPTTDEVTADLSRDRTAIIVTYRAFRVQSGAGAPPEEVRKLCRLSLMVSHPPDVTVGITSSELAGQASVATGASAAVRSSHYWEGNVVAVPSEETMAGPLEGQWEVTFPPTIVEPIVEGCGQSRALLLYTDLNVPAGTSDPAESNVMAMAGGPGRPNATYHLLWQDCPQPAS